MQDSKHHPDRREEWREPDEQEEDKEKDRPRSPDVDVDIQPIVPDSDLYEKRPQLPPDKIQEIIDSIDDDDQPEPVRPPTYH